jgi:hypothetical protein
LNLTNILVGCLVKTAHFRGGDSSGIPDSAHIAGLMAGLVRFHGNQCAVFNHEKVRFARAEWEMTP